MGYQSRRDLDRMQIRIEAPLEMNESASEAICKILEETGYEIVEWGRLFPIRSAPDSGVLRSYITAVKKGSCDE